MLIPNFITHYSRGKPFQSISSLTSLNQNQVIESLDESNAWGLARFQDPDYLPSRARTEKLLRDKFQEIGGNPVLEHPIYFFLGRSHGFEKHQDNRAYIISLSKIPTEMISFTYGDSLLSFEQKYRTLSGEKYKNQLCDQVFRLENLVDLFSHSDFPNTDPLHIEAQLWIQPSENWVNLDRPQL